MSLRTDETKALKKGQKALMRCRREVGVAAFATEQANLKRASENLRTVIRSVANHEELFDEWLRKARLEKVRKS